MVDANPVGIEEARKRLKGFADNTAVVHVSLFDEYSSDIKYDLVWAEGCLPHQADPIPLLKHMGGFVAEGGGLCMTTANGVSYLAETLRRLFRDRFFPDLDGSVHEQAAVLSSYYRPHLRHLRGMSRPIVDWILDNIIQPLHDRQLLSIPDVVCAIETDFDVYGSAPRFLTDWRWYKEILGDDRGYNALALSNYYCRNLNLIDYRYEFPDHAEPFGVKLEELCSRSWAIMCDIETGNEDGWASLFSLLGEIAELITPLAPETAMAITEANAMLQYGAPDMKLHHFPQWWGRGQQYLSLIKTR
ncbi:SAM-dependent methyltransferase [Chlorobium phaeovibrioides]|uniref:SAM-dependent methyltransferase n=1 Tax=Chlorobium phaeovibrioides TaxID=1094 RepID=A0A432ASB1_CHLPH|nr:class I SAM-dependent methyltransferase [Chlorobium phaeovibrioides]RTY35183.1 SAM-dependent methyltransferase [Chlorobium phaeovibrioides]